VCVLIGKERKGKGGDLAQEGKSRMEREIDRKRKREREMGSQDIQKVGNHRHPCVRPFFFSFFFLFTRRKKGGVGIVWRRGTTKEKKDKQDKSERAGFDHA
jgi:hypothetical protein